MPKKEFFAPTPFRETAVVNDSVRATYTVKGRRKRVTAIVVSCVPRFVYDAAAAVNDLRGFTTVTVYKGGGGPSAGTGQAAGFPSGDSVEDTVKDTIVVDAFVGLTPAVGPQTLLTNFIVESDESFTIEVPRFWPDNFAAQKDLRVMVYPVWQDADAPDANSGNTYRAV